MGLQEIIERTRKRKAEGANQVYPKQLRAGAPARSLPVIRAACVHTGARVTGQPCGSPLLRCLKFGDVTTRFTPCSGAQRCCAACDDYSAPS